jgi:hypothetical protein
MQNDLAKPGLQNEENNDNGPPDGFTLFVAPDDEQYLIPSFLIEATKFAFHHKDTTEELRPDTAAGGVSAWRSNPALLAYSPALCSAI